jgi:hypothetical protein
MRNNLMFAIIAVVAISLPGTPNAAADPLGVPGFIMVESGGEAMLVCTAPGFINCSLAAAFAVGGCREILRNEICVSASAGAVGSVSSVGVPVVGRGGATGTVNAIPTACAWYGSSGGCISVIGSLGFDCGPVNVVSNGYISVDPPIPATTTIFVGIPAPTATAAATNPCTLLNPASMSQSDEVPEGGADEVRALVNAVASEGALGLAAELADIGSPISEEQVDDLRMDLVAQGLEAFGLSA